MGSRDFSTCAVALGGWVPRNHHPFSLIRPPRAPPATRVLVGPEQGGGAVPWQEGLGASGCAGRTGRRAPGPRARTPGPIGSPTPAAQLRWPPEQRGAALASGCPKPSDAEFSCWWLCFLRALAGPPIPAWLPGGSTGFPLHGQERACSLGQGSARCDLRGLVLSAPPRWGWLVALQNHVDLVRGFPAGSRASAVGSMARSPTPWPRGSHTFSLHSHPRLRGPRLAQCSRARVKTPPSQERLT